MSKNRKRNGRGKKVGLALLSVVYFVLLIKVLLHGNNIALFNPKGAIAQEQLNLILLTVAILLAVAVPAIALLYFTAWKYRETNNKAKRDAEAGHGKFLNMIMWLIPSTFMLVLALVMWPATHRLEPQKRITADAKHLTVQVVALRWKWLFIYPEQKVASVNYLQLPADTPVTFELTADEAPMSSFWIPNLGGMLYAMTGHANSLNLVTGTPGEYPGSSAEINGAGFAGMKFIANVTSKADFDIWARDLNLTSDVLNAAEYERLLKPSESNPAAYYSVRDNDLYDKVLMKYMGSHEGHVPQEASHE